jgi:acyl-CoA synthetase (AMP-forming)/AMP-acid ligase II
MVLQRERRDDPMHRSALVQDVVEIAHADLVSHIRAQVAKYGDTRACTYLREAGRDLVEDIVTFSDLDRDARAIAAWLAEREDAGRPVLLLYVDAIEFLRAFLGCLYAGVVAVPAPLPHDESSRQRSAGLFDDADIRLVLTTAEHRPQLTDWMLSGGFADRVAVVATDAEPLGDPDAWRQPPLTGDSVAFLQYTSGSTSAPKGVVVSHANLLHNEAAIAAALGIGDDTRLVGWLPHFHDMGLIGMLLQVIYSGANLAFMSPITFLKRPVRWLEAIDRYRADITVAPNFAYELVARRVSDADLAELDLSSLRVALNGAEPIRAHTLDAVIERLGSAGFRPDAFVTAYGMAEVTLLATASRPGHRPSSYDVDPAALERNELAPAGAHGSTRLVGCGFPAEVDVRIVAPDTRVVLPDDAVGEIWLRGDSVAAGYLGRPGESRARFAARTATGDGPFLRTGDLGALHGGELIVTGRLKDLLIVNGRNIYPQDIEEAVRQLHPALDDAPGVVLTVDAGREHIVVIQGVRRSALAGTTPTELVAQIKRTVARTFEVPAPNVVLLDRRGVHRTTSGKVQRRSMHAAFLNNDLDALLHEDIDPAVQRLRRTP